MNKQRFKRVVIPLLCVALYCICSFASGNLWFTENWAYTEYLDYLGIICLIIGIYYRFWSK